MMRENIALNMYSSKEIINYPTQLHLAGHFLKLPVNAVFKILQFSGRE
jgi:hypothetical protein